MVSARINSGTLAIALNGPAGSISAGDEQPVTSKLAQSNAATIRMVIHLELGMKFIGQAVWVPWAQSGERGCCYSPRVFAEQHCKVDMDHEAHCRRVPRSRLSIFLHTIRSNVATPWLVTLLVLTVPRFGAASEEDMANKRPRDTGPPKTLLELRGDLDAGRTTSVSQVQEYLKRIDALDRRGPKLQSVLAVNPEALAQARELDRELKQKGARGPLHGIAVLIKDNIETADPLATTAGSLALARNLTGRDAPIVANLRAAGAVVLGKTNLSEWANFRSQSSLSGWSAIGGLTRNPHVLDRSACGSSSGSAAAVAAGLAAASVGTETDGSITCPAAMNGLVGLKPTVGLLSGERIVPISHTQDTAGPMTLTVTDAALLLAGMRGSAAGCGPKQVACDTNYSAALTPSALQGKRIGVWRFEAGRFPMLEPVYERALGVLRGAGAILVDVAVPELGPVFQAEEVVLFNEFKVDLNAYLATTPAAVTTRTLAQLIEFNRQQPQELSLFGQDIFIKSQATAGLESEEYKKAVADGQRLAGAEGIARVLSENQLDLLVAPTTSSSWRVDVANGDQFGGSFTTLPAVSGYPHLTVPMGDIRGLPVGVSFIGLPWSEALLLGAGFVFESGAKVRITPKFIASLEAKEKAFERPQ
jgi:amidase